MLYIHLIVNEEEKRIKHKGIIVSCCVAPQYLIVDGGVPDYSTPSALVVYGSGCP